MISAKALHGTIIEARDGHIGSVKDLYFDDQAWKIRYLVVNTGKWLPGRIVLIAPEAIVQAWHGESGLPVDLTKDQIRSSPDVYTAEPISRRAEQLLYAHYGWIPYWAAVGIEPVVVPQFASTLEERRDAIQEAESTGDPHLHSIKEVTGYP